MSNPLNEASNFVESLGNAGQSIIDTGVGTVEKFLDDPLPVIATVALTYYLGPEGAAVFESEATAAVMANAVVSAANGGNMEQIAVAAATSYIGGKIGEAAGTKLPEGTDKIVKQVVTSASGSAAVTALQGGSFKDVLTAGLTSSVSGYVSASLKAQGFSKVDNQLLTNATSAATKAILKGKSISEAIGSSVAATAISATISGDITKINQNNELGKALQKTYDNTYSWAKGLYDDYVAPSEKAVQKQHDDIVSAQQAYVDAYNKMNVPYQSYLKNKDWFDNYDKKLVAEGWEAYNDGEGNSGYMKRSGGSWKNIPDGEGGYYRSYVADKPGTYDSEGYQITPSSIKIDYNPPSKDSYRVAANADAKKVKELLGSVELAKASYDLVSKDYDKNVADLTELQNTFKTDAWSKVEDAADAIDKINADQTALVKTVGENVAKYEEQLKSDAADLAKQIGEETVTTAKNEIGAIDKGFLSYADQQDAGSDAAPDYYAKKDGYADAADKTKAVDSGFTDSGTYKEATKNGFENATDYKAATDFGVKTNSEYQEKLSSINKEFNQSLGRDASYDELKSVFTSGENVVDKAKSVIEPQYTDESEVNSLVRDQLGRDATPEEIAKYTGATSNVDSEKKIASYADPLKTTEDEVIDFFKENVGREPTPSEVAKFVGYTPDSKTLTNLNVEEKLINGLDLPEDYKFPDLKTEVKFADAFKANREAFGPGYVFEWTNPKTGIVGKYTTNNETEEAVAAQKRVDQLPAFGGSRNTQTGRPESATENIYVDKKTGDIINDTRVWDEQGNVISGSLQTNYESPTVNEATKALSNAIKTGLDVGSGVIKGGADVIGQVGVLGALIGVADPSNLLTKTADQIRASVDSMRSTEFKNKESLMYDAIAKAGNDGFFAQLVETGKQFGANPAQTAEFISRNGVSLLVGTGAMTTFRALGAGMTAAEAATIGTQAALQGASVAEEAYKDAVKNGKTDAEALNAARVAGAIGSATSFLSNKFIPGALSNEQRLAGEAVAKNSVSAALRGEITSELSEEVSGKIAGNIASGNPWDKDLGSTAVQAVIGSGAVTGLAHVGTIGNVDTAVAIAEDAGATPDDIKQIKSYSSSSLGTDNYGSDQQLNESIQRLQDYGLSEAEAKQVGGKLYESSVDEKVTSYLESQGVAADKAAELSKEITANIIGGASAPDAINSIAAQLTENTGVNSLDATLATNKFLTGTDVTQEVNNTLSKYNYSATPEQISSMISANAAANKGDLASNVVNTKVTDILTNSGLSTDVASTLAPTIANSVLSGEGLDTSVKLVADQIAKATGQDPLTSSIIANEALTGSNLKTDIDSQLEAMGYKPTEQEISDLINQNLMTQKTDLGIKIEEYVDPRFVNQQEALAALNANLATQITPTQLNMLIGQYNESELPEKAIASVLAGNISAEQEAEAERQKKAELAEKAKSLMLPATSTSTAAGVKQFGQPNVPNQTPSTSPLAAAGLLAPTFLSSKGAQEKFQGPLDEFQRLQDEPFAGENQYEGIAPNEPTQEQTSMNDAYYSYGQNSSIDDIMTPNNVQNTTNPDWLNAANQGLITQPGGLVANMYAAGGITGTRHGKYAHGGLSTPLMAAGGKLRVDFRHGDAVTGAGDGQSDDIPAMLADGEFVFPADVVAAIGNGSTKAGSDKLYDMMHGIRAHVRSAKPKDLPPEIKSPLDFLKTKPRKARRK